MNLTASWSAIAPPMTSANGQRTTTCSIISNWLSRNGRRTGRTDPEIIYNIYIMDQLTLGVGTRLQHTALGPGVIVGVRYADYLISFIHHGIKEVKKDDPQLDEIIPENVTVEVETHSEMERSLLGILQLWGGLTELVPLGDKW